MTSASPESWCIKYIMNACIQMYPRKAALFINIKGIEALLNDVQISKCIWVLYNLLGSAFQVLLLLLFCFCSVLPTLIKYWKRWQYTMITEKLTYINVFLKGISKFTYLFRVRQSWQHWWKTGCHYVYIHKVKNLFCRKM